MTVTEHFDWNLPDPEDSMADTSDSFNNSFFGMNTTLMGPTRGVVTGSVLPTKTGTSAPSDYVPGDTIYLSGWKSNFILVASDPSTGSNAYWGYIWRPIHAAWSPWVPVPSTAWPDPSHYGPAPKNPLQYRTSNRGEFQFSGGASTVGSTIWPKYTGTAQTLLKLPVNVAPPLAATFACTLCLPNLTLTNKPYQFANMSMSIHGTFDVRVYNSSVANDGVCTELHFNNVVWDMGNRTDLSG